MKTEELVNALRVRGYHASGMDRLGDAKDFKNAADTIERQSATIKALTEALARFCDNPQPTDVWLELTSLDRRMFKEGRKALAQAREEE